MNEELEQVKSDLRILAQRVESLEHAWHQALLTINTIGLKLQYWELKQRQQEGKQGDE